MSKVLITELALVCLTLTALPVEAQELFQRVFGGNGYDSGSEIIQKADGNYMIAASSGSYEEGMSSQIVLMEINTEGYEEWRRTYGGPFADQAESMVEDADGNYLITGFTETIDNSYQGYALKLTPIGDTIWTRKYGGPQWDLIRQVVALPDGGFALFGQTYSYGAGEGDFYLIRIDSEGDTVWTRTYGGTADESGHAISLTAAGGFYLTGHTRSFGNGAADGYVIKTDQFGDTIWTRTFGGAEDEFCYGATSTFDDGIVAVGGTFSNTPGEADFMMYKLSATGDSVKARIEDGSTDEFWTDVIEDPQTNALVACGWVDDSEFGQTDFRLFRVNQILNFDGIAVSRGSEDNDRMFDVKKTMDNGYILVGVSDGFLKRFDDIYVYKGDEFGLSEENPELSIDEVIVGKETFQITVFPNPIRDQASLQIEGFETIEKHYEGDLSVRLMDPLGAIIKEQPVNQDLSSIDLRNISSGVYVYQLVSRTEVISTGKVLKVADR